MGRANAHAARDSAQVSNAERDNLTREEQAHGHGTEVEDTASQAFLCHCVRCGYS